LIADHEKLIRTEQVKLLYAGMPVSALATIANALVLTAAVWSSTGHVPMIIWLTGMMVITLARFLLKLAYDRVQPDVEQNSRWERHFIIGTMAAGVMWGSASLLIFPEDSIVHQVFLAFIIGGMAAGAVSSLSSSRVPIFGFQLFSLGPLIVRFLLEDTGTAHAMCAMLLFFLVMIAINANRFFLNISQNIELRLQSQTGVTTLAESEERFRELFEGNKSVELIVEPNSGRIIEANHAAEKFYGYPRALLLGMNIWDINILSRDQVHAAMELARGERRERFLFRHRLANGEIRDVEVHSGPIPWNKQRVLYSIIHDVSERVRAEHLIKGTSRILEMVASGEKVENIYDAICRMHESLHPRMRASILRLQGNQLFHCSAPSLPAEYCQAINGAEIGPAAGSCGTAAFLGREVIVEDIAGDPLWADYKKIALPHDLRACWSAPIIGSDGKVMGTFAMYFDQLSRPTNEEIMEIRSASKLVAIVMEREQRGSLLLKLSQAIEQAGESIIISDKQGIIEYVNPAFSRITGYTSEEVLGRNPRLLKSGSQGAEYYARMWGALSRGETWQSSIIDRRKDGSQYPALMTISPIRDGNGQISHYVGIQQDMTEHEMLEEKFRQAQKMEALGTLVGGIAHDFNNMLAGMTGNLYLARKKVADFPDVVKKLDSVEALSFRASDMIKQLLTFARKSHVDMKPFGLTSFLKEATRLNEASIPENITLHCEFCPVELVVRGDATQLQQVVMNLLNNARDALVGVEQPRISLRLEEFSVNDAFINRHPEIDATLLAHLIIEDNGPGIGDDEREHIFEPFYTTKEVGRGTGLGLAMAYGTVHSHGGVIEVESVAGQGTVFHIYLPLLEEKGFEPVAEGSAGLVSGHGEIILIVDDNANVRDTGRDVLLAIGYRVLEASDGLEAIDRFVAHRDEIALIIMDVVMPKLGGVAAAERIRQLDPDARIIFATGYDKNAALKSEMPSDEHMILSKPYNVEELSRVIGELLS